MLFETVEQAAPAASAPATEVAEPSTHVEGSEPTSTELKEPGAEGAELETQPTEPEDTDFEYEGKKFKVPKDIEAELKNALLRHRDYTQKTQTVAEERKAIEAERAAHQETVKVHQALTKEVSQAMGIDERIQQLSQVNWNALIAQNPQQAQSLQAEFMQLQAVRGQLGNSITQKHQQLQFAAQQENAKRANEAQAFLMRELKDWSPEKDKALSEFARSQGLDSSKLGQFLIHNPAIAIVLNKAMQFDQSAKKLVAAVKKPEPPPKPVSRVTGNAASNTKALSDLSTEEYAARRQERRNQQRR